MWRNDSRLSKETLKLYQMETDLIMKTVENRNLFAMGQAKLRISDRLEVA